MIKITGIRNFGKHVVPPTSEIFYILGALQILHCPYRHTESLTYSYLHFIIQ